MRASDLRVDSGGDGFYATGPRPRLSWLPTVDIGPVRATEFEARVDDVLQPPLVIGADHVLVPWPGPALASRSRVEWRVRPVGGLSRGEWSPPATFEVGLLDEDWQARWISPVEDEDPGPGRRPAHRLAVKFDLPDGDVVRARLYATALGVYEAFVNGHRSGTTVLAPGSTSYDRTLHAQAYDVTGDLCGGTNRLDVLLSDGWYRGQVGAFRVPADWGEHVAVRAELHVDLADGRSVVIRTDPSWTSTSSTILSTDLMDGQTTDLRAAVDGPRPVGVDLVTAPAVSWSPAPPVRVVETRSPESVTKVAGNAWLVDFGQNASGWVRLSDLGPEGTRTVLDHGEFVGADKDLDTSHLDSTRPDVGTRVFLQRDMVVSDGTEAVFEPRHTIHGFQYVRVERDGADFDPGSIQMCVVHTDLRRTGTFACSDPDITRLHDAADWSFRGNAVDVPTDCPTRERLAWTGDYQVFAPTATRLFDVAGFTRKWLQSVRDDQLDDGRISNFAPDGRRIRHHLDDQFAMLTGSAGWGDAIVAVPWEMYRSYGDVEVLRENWDAMVRWVEWALETARTARHHSRVQRSAEPQDHEQFLWDGSFHWGEWVEPLPRDAGGKRLDPVQDNPMAWFMEDKGEVGTAYLYRSTSTLARVAEILALTAEADRYARTAQQVGHAWRTEYLRPDGHTSADTQAAYVRALAFGLVPDGLRPAALERLVELIESADMHLATGFLSTGHLLPVLADHGRADVAHALLFQRTPPSWLYMLDRGATTIWEDWEGIDDNGHAHESLNHYSKGSVVRFLHTHTVGLRQDHGSSAWRRFTVAPLVPPGVTWAEGSHDTPLGTISVRWEVVDGHLALDVVVPAGATATLHLPGTAPEVVPGPAALRRCSPDPVSGRPGPS